MSERTKSDLRMMQSLPLDAKIAMTRTRIKGWINEYGEDSVYISFSGGKDSTVLMDLVRNECGYGDDIKAAFVDVPTQYPELRDFAKTFENVDILMPNMSFMEVCEKHGFPLISKEVSDVVYGARQYLKRLEITDADEKVPYKYWYDRLTGQGDYAKQDLDKLAGQLSSNLKDKSGGSNYRTAMLLGLLQKDGKICVPENRKDRSNFSQKKYKFFLEAPFEISNKCCDLLKKKPAHDYSKQTGRLPITAQMAYESALRQQQWLKNGCNGFKMKSPISNPMSFWTEQDVLQYIKDRNLPICSVYGDVVEDDNRLFMPLDTDKPKLRTTGCSRTGCMMCGFGCHLEKPGKGRFEMLKETHSKMYSLLDLCKNNGVTFREAIEWTNEHGNFNIQL